MTTSCHRRGENNDDKNNNHGPHDDDDDDDDDDDNDDEAPTSILAAFDQLCSSGHGGEDDAIWDARTDTSLVCNLELQELSRILARQLWYRYRPDFVLMVECLGHVVPEAVTVLACQRLGVPFVPIALQTAATHPHRLAQLVQQLQSSDWSLAAAPTGQPQQQQQQSQEPPKPPKSVVAVCCMDNDLDPRLGILYAANVHVVIYMDAMGNVLEQLRVPQSLPAQRSPPSLDALYVLFTSGSTASSPSPNGPSQPKAVVGSHRSTWRRLQWWLRCRRRRQQQQQQQQHHDHNNDGPSNRVARKTRLTFVDGITELLGTLLDPDSVLVTWTPDDQTSGNRNGDHDQVLDVCQVVRDWKPNQITVLPSQLALLLSFWKDESRKQKSQEQSASPKGEKEGDDDNDDEWSIGMTWLNCILVSGEVFPAWLWRACCQTLDLNNKKNNNKSNATNGRSTPQIWNLYGQTESTGDVLAANLTDLPDHVVICQGVVAVGRPILPTIQITTQPIAHSNNRIMDNDHHHHHHEKEEQDGVVEDTLLPQQRPELETHAQEILVQGNLSHGYLKDYYSYPNNTDASNQSTTATPNSITTHSFFQQQPFATGDVGFCANDGIWYIQGRCNDVGNINGILTSPQEIETAFASVYLLSEWNRDDNNKNKNNNNQHKWEDSRNYSIGSCAAVLLPQSTAPHHAATGAAAAAAIIGTANNTAVSYLLTDQAWAAESFSRSHMHQAGIPWHLIPRQVFACSHPLPVQGGGGGGGGGGGAPKVDRQQVAQIIQQRLLLLLESEQNPKPGKAKEKMSPTATTSNLVSLVQRVLGHEPCTATGTQLALDPLKSFIDLGGDSAKAVQLLYLLRQEFQQLQQQHDRDLATSTSMPRPGNISVRSRLQNLRATDILQSTNLLELEEFLWHGTAGGGSGIRSQLSHGGNNKKPKLRIQKQRMERPPFQPAEPCHVNNQHITISFAACVDGSPQIDTPWLSSTMISNRNGSSRSPDNAELAMEADDTITKDRTSIPGIRNCSIYAACQGGVVQQICASTCKVLAHRQFQDWMFQADPFIWDRGVILCGSSRDHSAASPLPSTDEHDKQPQEEKAPEHQEREHDPAQEERSSRSSLIVALGHNLEHLLWSLELPPANCGGGGILSTPIQLPGDPPKLLAVTSKAVYIVNMYTGSLLQTLSTTHDDYMGTPLLLCGNPPTSGSTGMGDDAIVICTGPTALAWIRVAASATRSDQRRQQLENEQEPVASILKEVTLEEFYRVHDSPNTNNDEKRPTMIGPVYKNAAKLVVQRTRHAATPEEVELVVLADSYGQLHVLQHQHHHHQQQEQHHHQQQSSLPVPSVRIVGGSDSESHHSGCGCPLSSPAVITIDQKSFVVVGSYNGNVYCYQLVWCPNNKDDNDDSNPRKKDSNATDEICLDLKWTRFVGASVYAKPLIYIEQFRIGGGDRDDKDQNMTDNVTPSSPLSLSFMICVVTTAGHVVQLDGRTGRNLLQYRLASAEIWSTPALLLPIPPRPEQHEQQEQQQEQREQAARNHPPQPRLGATTTRTLEHCVVFGARDSKLHMIRLKSPT
ncbi:hypothetical protein ACA910_014148 [Epithemia clementina (nom. ined.)]